MHLPQFMHISMSEIVIKNPQPNPHPQKTNLHTHIKNIIHNGNRYTTRYFMPFSNARNYYS